MRIAKLLPIAAGTFALAACATTYGGEREMISSAPLISADGTAAGTATLLSEGSSIYVSIEATGLSEGQHGFHLHQSGQCTRPDFTSAGGHLNPTDKSHGIYSPDGPHLGDLPNLNVGADGRANAEAVLVGSRDGILADIFDADGTAVIVHAGADDYRTDPAGDAGSRVLCGVFGPLN
ncbi:superoxide dismutase family protein [Altererythrobacter aurantiacus]|uniref:Superoxide dismutase family protein n=1 Tax=Parapontixanthobacter aurantiacus TaxID=1463599 RepID=A0A844ZF41_9SPHN|nr:superoxide dismutase family protein [Parapontixanthobacter aurantiacus]MXO86164.1 superoxide dismutase family protein [Parapontixanthobacter aurantiacus]